MGLCKHFWHNARYAKCLHRPIVIINQQYTKGEIHFIKNNNAVFRCVKKENNAWNVNISESGTNIAWTALRNGSALRIIYHKSRKRHSFLIFTILPTNIVKLSYQPSYNAHDVLFLQYSQSYPQDFPRMTSLSLTRKGGWLATRPVSRVKWLWRHRQTRRSGNVVRLLIFRRLRRKNTLLGLI